VTPIRMHSDEIATDDALVRRLLADQFPHWAELPVAQIPSAGTDNALYRLGRDMLIRMPRIHWAADDVRKEQHWLPRLAPHLPVAIPAPVALGDPAAGYPWPWSIYRWLEGETPSVDAISNPMALAHDLAAFVTALRRIDTTHAPRTLRGVPLIERDAQTRAAIAQLRGKVDIQGVVSAWDDALATPPWPRPPVWIHGDLAPGNLLIDNGRLDAVIDFGSAGIGDPAADMLIAWTLLPPGARGAYRTALGVDADTWKRGRGQALSIALIQLPYYEHTNLPLAASARHVIGEVLTDLESPG